MPGRNGDAIVEAIGLTKVFKDFWGRPKARAVNGIDFTVRRGQVFGLLGPNGSGKSTTVKMVLGLLYPTRGTLRVLGEDPQDVRTKERVGYLPEETYLYKYLTAAETLDFFGALFGLAPQERRNRSQQLLEMVGLANSFNRPVGEFSKGMARRIGLAQALVNDPDLVILDEPTSGLDPIGCREVKDVIRLLARRGKTVLMCSHLLADVQDICDEVVVLYGGRIRSQGALREVLTVQDRTRLVMPRLEARQQEALVAWLRGNGIQGEVQIDSPTMDLEDFFLEVVRQARDASLETAGAQSGGQIAAYLRGGEEAAPADAHAVLEALSRDPGGEAAGGTEEAQPPEAEAAAEIDRGKLEQLSGAAPEPAPRQAEATDAKAPEGVDLEKARERLKGLLGGTDTPRRDG
ncbi:MAG: ABC transporter ATP-binding protein [Lentisphaeria bacterium]|nr:ABC transporter ATP-binding protein [Lentisphaeria bacterium]